MRDLANNSGTVIDHVDYDAYGNVKGESAPGVGDRWKYTGREFDTASGQYYYRARWYMASVGSFSSNDPLSFGGDSINLYEYSKNSPTNFVDPNGKQVGNPYENGYLPGSLSGPTPAELAFQNFINHLEDSGVPQDVIDRIIRSRGTQIPFFGWLPNQTFPNNLPGSNHCVRWAKQFESNVSDPGTGLLAGPGTGVAWGGVVFWETGNYVWPIHAAYKIVLCDGSVWYFDNGSIFSFFATNNLWGISKPTDIPPGWVEQGGGSPQNVIRPR